MNDNEKAMKYFMIFAPAAGAAVPLGLEIYTNVSHAAGYFIAALLTVIAAVKFSPLPVKDALLGITSYVFSAVVLSIIGYMLIHPAAVSWIKHNSEYIEPLAVDVIRYWVSAFLMIFAVYPIYFAVKGIKKAAGRLEQNAEKTASAIDNAFDDTDKPL